MDTISHILFSGYSGGVDRGGGGGWMKSYLIIHWSFSLDIWIHNTHQHNDYHKQQWHATKTFGFLLKLPLFTFIGCMCVFANVIILSEYHQD